MSSIPEKPLKETEKLPHALQKKIASKPDSNKCEAQASGAPTSARCATQQDHINEREK